ncbi:MAG: DNA alkylation repair protein [Bacteroidota bacterium]
MNTVEEVLKELKKKSSKEVREGRERFGINTGKVISLGVSVPDMRALAKQIGKNQELALELWKTNIHEARHVALFISEKKKITDKLMETWLKDFNSWDIVDNACSSFFIHSPNAYEKAIEWTSRKKEFEKRTGFSLMCYLAVHDKQAEDAKFEQFFPYIYKESNDERNFVKKAINWAIRQIGKRNERLCKKVIKLTKDIQKKEDASSKWIAADALRELEKYLVEGKIKDVGKK